MSFYIVGLTDPATRLAVCPDLKAVEEFVGTLPDFESGKYYIDECEETVVLQYPGTFKPGDRVDILIRGAWEGPYTVVAATGRTPDHVVLQSEYGMFEQYNDAPYNIRHA